MSLISMSHALDQSLETCINNFISKIIKNYQLPLTENKVLFTLWETVKDSKKNKNIELNLNIICKATKKELISYCKKYKLKVSGNKNILIDRLRNYLTVEKLETKVGKIITNIQPTKQEVIQIRKNKYNNYEHPETRFIFNKYEQKVIGIQQDDGTIKSLTQTDLDLCNKYKFAYDIPDVLDEVNIEEDLEEINEEDFSEEEYFSEEN